MSIDDTGTGFASLSVVLEVAPEIIKLDRELTANINVDPVRRALASALVTFGAEMGANVIAEGIETAAELAVLTELGIGYGQGFYLGRPGSLEDLVMRLRAGYQLQVPLIQLLTICRWTWVGPATVAAIGRSPRDGC